MEGDGKQVKRIKIQRHSFAGMLWFAAWLFTVGFLQLGFLVWGACTCDLTALSWREIERAGALVLRGCRLRVACHEGR